MTMTKGRIERIGEVIFHDASLHVWEEGIPGDWNAKEAWERMFKRDVFKRIVQTLNRLGWNVGPWSDAERYKALALNHRTCRKGDLQAELSISGRHIEFQMWQDVQNVTHRSGGKYEFDKADRMTYLQQLEMERTRCRIRDYLCNVFTGYEFRPPKISSPNPDPLAYFNDGWDSEYEKRRGTHRFQRGADGWPSDREISSWDRKDKDGVQLNHGDVRWMFDRKGRLIRGRVYGGINGMWLFVYGRGNRDYTHDSARHFFTYRPGETPRKQINAADRKKRLESVMAKAVGEMDFERAAAVRDILLRDYLAPESRRAEVPA
ncbi:hypothetical protein [Burkholderia pseudomallei]|uniref:hypothetical protein n=1 Tax=Burkholderia pseudomallei TaxID=28450 RepID=UPI0005D8719F|nr:hypothetical protein [Burkholderia pseudomallei]AJX60272.1 uvrB/uvrC motif family protein [Burkholderia pseudomallei Pasteur 52237]VBQ81329.1 Uncharacterised protein [Burkholderia pseudomallei]